MGQPSLGMTTSLERIGKSASERIGRIGISHSRQHPLLRQIIALLSICNISLSIGNFFGAIRIRDMSLSLSVLDRLFIYGQKNIGNHNRHASVYRLSLKLGGFRR
jgi:hypothetical protein